MDLYPCYSAGRLSGRVHRRRQLTLARYSSRADRAPRREHYARRSSPAWLENFEANLPAITTILTAEQVRVWRLYLAGGALAFEQGRMGVDQILAVKPQGPRR